MLGVDPMLGRTFTPDDDGAGKPPVAVLSYALWQRRFGGQANIVGQPITLNGVKFTIIVMPAHFQFHIKHRSGTGRPAELWTILPMPIGPGANKRGRFLSVVGRLKDGVSVAQAGAELRTIEARLADEAPQFNKNYSAEVLPLREQFFGNVRRPLWLMLLASAGLLIKSFMRLQKVDRGFNTDNVLTMVVRLPDAAYREDPQIVNFFVQALERIRSLPTVRSAGVINFLPLYGGLGSSTGFKIEGRPEPPPGQGPGTDVRVVDAGYFETMGIPLLRGRNFSSLELREPRRVILINEALARKHFANEDPIGKRLDVAMFENPIWCEIIGVVGNVRYDSLIDESPPAVYFAHPDLAYSFMTLVISTEGDPASIAPAVQRDLATDLHRLTLKKTRMPLTLSASSV